MEKIKVMNNTGMTLNIDFNPTTHNDGSDNDQTLISIGAPNTLGIKSKETNKITNITNLDLTVFGSCEQSELINDIIALGRLLESYRNNTFLPQVTIKF